MSTVAAPRPWTTIWTRPRHTIQEIVEHDAERYVVPLSALAGVSQALDRASIRSAGDTLELPVILLGAAAGGAVSGVVMLYVFAFVLKWTCTWVGGSASRLNIRAAIAWSSIPIICLLPLWVPQLLLFGEDLFRSYAPRIDQHFSAFLALAAVEATVAVWGLVIFFKCLGQVSGVPAWRAAAAVLLAAGLIVAPLVALAFGIDLVHG